MKKKKLFVITGIALITGIGIGKLIPNNNEQDKIILAETIDYIGDMKEWLAEDIGNNILDDQYGNYYYSGLSDCEDNLIELYKLNTK